MQFSQQAKTADQSEQTGDTRDHHDPALGLGRSRKRVKSVPEKNQQRADVKDVIDGWVHMKLEN